MQSAAKTAPATRPVTGNVFLYHGYEIVLHEPIATHNARFGMHHVNVRHRRCNQARWFKLYTSTTTALLSELRPILDTHTCQ